MFKLDNKTALISGGARGIGRGIGEVLLKAGATVYFCDLDAEEGKRTADELDGGTGRAFFLRADVTRRDEMVGFADAAMTGTGRIDIVINNASCTTGPQNDLLNASDDEWDKNIRIGLHGTRNLTGACLPHMIKGGGGSVIVISSIQALAGCPASTAYTTVKAAQLGFIKSVAVDYGPRNIRANAICPGPIKVWYSPEPGTPAHDTQKALTMLNRTGTPHEIGYAALYLASDEGSFVTGTTLTVDGGWTAK